MPTHFIPGSISLQSQDPFVLFKATEQAQVCLTLPDSHEGMLTSTSSSKRGDGEVALGLPFGCWVRVPHLRANQNRLGIWAHATWSKVVVGTCVLSVMVALNLLRT